MEEVLAHRLSAAGSMGSRTWVWVRAVTDLMGHAVLERLRPDGPAKRRGEGMGTWMQDMRWAVHTLRRSPLFTTVAALTLAAGIGAATATFSVVRAVLFKDLPYREPGRLVEIWPHTNFNNAMVREAVAAMPAVEAASGISGWELTLVGEGEPTDVSANRVSPDHFRVLGVEPALGRSFRDEEGLPGRGDVVILSHAFWARVFGSDPGAIGRTIDLSGADADRHTVIGVMPPDFRPVVGHPEVWVPMSYDPAQDLNADISWYVNYRVARLAQGVTLAQATEQVRRFARSVRDRMPSRYDEDDLRRATAQPLARYLAGDMATFMWVALAAVSLVLLIACANVANLLLARTESRDHDLAVRCALGAGRARVARMLLDESAILGLLGGGTGIALAFGFVRLVRSVAPADFPRLDDMAVDGTALAYAVAVSLGAVLLSGLAPALRASQVRATASLGGGTRASVARRRSRLTLAFVGAEVALAVVVTVGSGLMLRSLERLASIDIGLDTDGVLVMRANPPEGRYADGESFRDYYAQVMARLRPLPEVASVGAIHLLPGTPDNWSFPTWPEGVTYPDDAPVPTVNFRVVWPGYFRTVGLRPLRGRLLTDADGEGGEKVMLVNQAFVDRFWPGQDPIGRSVRTLSSQNDPYRVVGVVGNVRQHGLAREPRPEMYLTPREWVYNVGLWVVVKLRDARSPMGHAAVIQEAIWSVDSDVPITGLQELGAVYDRSAATTRFLTLVLGSFGALALLLGAIGVFGVTSYVVARRVPEFGVRLALGSSRRGVLASALFTCALPVAMGLFVGLAAAAGSTKVLGSVLFDIEPSDPATFVAVAATLIAVALLASLLPAWRASRVDPVRVLSAE